MLKLLLPYPWRCRDTGDKLCIYAKTHLTPFARIDRVGPDMGMTTVRTMTAAPEMLELLNHYKIRIGTKLKVTRHFDFDESVEIKIEKSPAIIVSKQVAQNLFCII